jgi:hypothetical protein
MANSSHCIMSGARRSIELAAIACAVQIVSAVSGFAQSNSAYRATNGRERTALSALREYVVISPREAWPEAVPPNLEAGIYRPIVEKMLKLSSTFRRQCWRIATASDLVVSLHPGNRPSVNRFRAKTRIARDGRHLVASIEIFTPELAAELIAHELEHVIEQLDGVDLAAKADVDSSGVKRGDASEPSFETVRATRMGLTVAAEVRRRTG